jgi:hypothetical protein
MLRHALRTRLDALRLHPSPRQHRCRMVYDLSQPSTLSCEQGSDGIALSQVEAAGMCVAEWARWRTSMPSEFYREVTVRMSSAGLLQLKLILQLPQQSLASSSFAEACSSAEEQLLELNYPAWHSERELLISFLRQNLPALSGVSFQIAIGTARPNKTKRCVAIHGPLNLLETHATFSYLVSPETMSQVNPATADMLVTRVAWWLGLGGVSPPELNLTASGPSTFDAAATAAAATAAAATAATAAAAAAAASVTASSPAILCLGRDVNLFGAALFAETSHALHILTHCPNAFADLGVNLKARLQRADANAAAANRTFLVGKGKATAAHLRSLVASSPSSSSAPALPGCSGSAHPEVAMVTAGRRGVSREVCAALRDALPLRVIVYVYCCEETMLTDLEELLKCPTEIPLESPTEVRDGAGCSGSRSGGALGARLGGFAVADAARYDHFPGSSGHVGGALLLLRRPGPCLVLPIGPVGSGKSELCRRLRSALPPKSCTAIERDGVLASLRLGSSCELEGETAEVEGRTPTPKIGGAGTPLGLGAAKRQTYRICIESLQRAARAQQLCIFDSCNASAAGRKHYAEMVRPELLLLVSFEPELGADATASDGCTQSWRQAHAQYRQVLLTRAMARVAHPTFPPACEPGRQVAALDATLAAMEWPAVESPADSSSELGDDDTTLAGPRGVCRRVRLHRCDPLASADENCASVLDQIVTHFLWLVGARGLFREHWMQPHPRNDDQSGGRVRLEIIRAARPGLGDVSIHGDGLDPWDGVILNILRHG